MNNNPIAFKLDPNATELLKRMEALIRECQGIVKSLARHPS